jgi:hypothetical protein
MNDRVWLSALALLVAFCLGMSLIFILGAALLVFA